MATGRINKRSRTWKNKDGSEKSSVSWEWTVHTGNNIDGKPERLRGSEETRHRAKNAMDRCLAELAGSGGISNRISLFDLSNRWLAAMERQVGLDIKPATYREYRQQIVKVIETLESMDARTVASLDSDILDRAIRDIASSHSSRWANKCLARLKRMLDYGEQNGLIGSNRFRGVRGVRVIRKKERRALTRDEAHALLAVSSEPWQTIWATFLATGLRHSELVNLDVREADLKTGLIRVTESAESSLKTEAAHRTIPITKSLRERLCGLIRGRRSGPLFKKIDGSSRGALNSNLKQFRRDMGRALAKIEFPGDIDEELKSLDIHSLRYTAITEWVDAGLNPKVVQTIAGHKSISTTLFFYAQPRDKTILESAEAMDYLDDNAILDAAKTPQRKNSQKRK